jgi:hydroxymethylbilane synthase
VGKVNGEEILRVEDRCPREDGEKLGRELAEKLLKMGADRILADIYGHTPT